jgi:hypothetical protein
MYMRRSELSIHLGSVIYRTKCRKGWVRSQPLCQLTPGEIECDWLSRRYECQARFTAYNSIISRPK